VSASASELDLTTLRARFAANLSALYGAEVPLYNTLIEQSAQVNRTVLAAAGVAAERLGSIQRVTAERHGAIRVGSVTELAQVARVFAAVGMYPCGFYDLRDAAPNPIPVVSTAFRPVDSAELARNPFRVFTSMLVTDDRRFFDRELQLELEVFLARRALFGDELLALADRSARHSGLAEPDASRFLDLATGAFALSTDPIDQAWYDRLARISSVAADIGGVASTHINHLTPRVLDIDELYRAMHERGVEMIDRIQGPPRWAGPDVLLRQTSFRALAEPRLFRTGDGSVHRGELRVRFGEVEARGIALTPAGRDTYDAIQTRVEQRMRDEPAAARTDVAARVWAEQMPGTEAGLFNADLAYFTVSARPERRGDGSTPPSNAVTLLEQGWLRAEPIVYEDFLPRSAAGIFASNLAAATAVDDSVSGSARDLEWLAGSIDREIHDPYRLYEGQRAESFRRAATELGLPRIEMPATVTHKRDSTAALGR
jgi:uncharacterized glyoxalase superfamily metalloenzyme YdcJ